ncbi:cobalamin-binding protein [Alicyclobacillus tolerans]|uniref:cobalamin-binding protein n=1 Tax=Alicyclobacillus tolerans TaxID=90970 RepID=UPI001F31E765|nr:cobalamin-binding protein [Alicyclobacillus tolerans]MCF8563493.1 cobalamin-binding protein [Alicyclobacillus tolerans]
MTSRLRIASLCPSNTELVFALGAGRFLVGIDNYSDYPPELVQELPKLGPDLHIDMERLAALKPDLTVASLSVPGMERVVEELKQTGLNYIVLSPHDLNGIFDDLRTLGQELTGFIPPNRTHEVISGLKERVDTVFAATQNLQAKPKLYWEWWPKPVFSPAKQNWLTEISHLAGATNIFFEMPGHQVQDDGTQVIAANPDYLLAVWTGVPQHKVALQKILARTTWSETPAFQKKQIYILPEGLYCRPSPRLVDGLEQLTALIHPEIARHLGLPSPSLLGPVRTADGQWLDGIRPVNVPED